jgi:hypothetical protein
MMRTLRADAAWLVAALGVAWAAVGKIRGAWAYAVDSNQASASDSLPLFLGAKAVHGGLDPTDQAVLQAVYSDADMQVTKAIFSVLYPPSFHVMLQPLAGLSHYGFLYYWRLILLGGLVAGLAVAGTAGVKGRRLPLAMALSVLGAFALFPLFVGVQLGLGQPNLLIVGLFGLAMGCVARGLPAWAGAFAVVGAGIKLVPAIILWPLLWAKRWRPVAIAAALGLGLAALTMAHVPFDRIVDNLASTWAFQKTVEPHWLHDPSLPTWGRFIGFLRRPSLLILSLVLIAWAVWSNRRDDGRRGEASAVGMALLATALAADSTGVGAYYATMAMPGMVAVLTWPLAERSSRGAWLAWPAVLSIVALTDGGLIYSTPDVEVRLVLACTIIWIAVAARLISLARPWPRKARLVGLGLVLLAFAYASLWTWRPPFGGHKTLPEAVPGSLTTPASPPVAPIPHDGTPR